MKQQLEKRVRRLEDICLTLIQMAQIILQGLDKLEEQLSEKSCRYGCTARVKAATMWLRNHGFLSERVVTFLFRVFPGLRST